MHTTPSGSYLKGSETLLHYIVRPSSLKTGKPPLLLLLHGVGSNEKDLFSLAGQLPPEFLVVSARAPYPLGADSYAWYQVDFSTGKPVYNKDQAEKSRTILLQFISQLKEKEEFNDREVYLMGFSQGAIMAYSAGLTRPDKIKGIAVMSGRLLDDVKPLMAARDQLKDLRVFISHGTQDQVLPLAYAREASGFLKQEGLAPVYKEYAEGHHISQQMLTDVTHWLKNN